jgi:hypothetical protein
MVAIVCIEGILTDVDVLGIMPAKPRPSISVDT